MPSTSDRFQARLEFSNWFLQVLSPSAARSSHPTPGSGAVDGTGYVERWEGALEQIKGHRRGCTCDPCVQARGYLERIKNLLDEIWPAEQSSSRDDRAKGTS
jgi:hypothetical protein